jgi:hypothetical protein
LGDLDAERVVTVAFDAISTHRSDREVCIGAACNEGGEREAIRKSAHGLLPCTLALARPGHF